MKNPCMAICAATNRKGDKGWGMRKKRSPWAWGGGWEGWEGLLMVGKQSLVIYLAVAMRHHRISAIPRIQIAVNQFPFSSEIQQGLCVSHIVISPTYHPAHVKTDYKGAAPLPLSLFPPFLPVYYTFALWANGHGFSSFPRPLFHPSLCSQWGCGFLQQCRWDQNCKGFLLLQRG